MEHQSRLFPNDFEDERKNYFDDTFGTSKKRKEKKGKTKTKNWKIKKEVSSRKQTVDKTRKKRLQIYTTITTTTTTTTRADDDDEERCS